MIMALELNVGKQDRNIRIAIGGLLAVIGLWKASFLLTLIGVIIIGTGLIRFCGLYKLLGINTATKDEATNPSQDLSERATQNFGEFKQEASKTYDEAKEKANETYEDLKQDASELADTAQKKAEELKTKAADAYQEAKQNAQELANKAEAKVDDAVDAVKKNT
jgi:vacuolar-type H+-ATPase subunit H